MSSAELPEFFPSNVHFLLALSVTSTTLGDFFCRQPAGALALLWCRGNYSNSFGPRPKEGKETQKSIDTQEETTLGAVSENWAAEGLKDGMVFSYGNFPWRKKIKKLLPQAKRSIGVYQCG